MPTHFRYLNAVLTIITLLWLNPLSGQAAFFEEIQQKWTNAGDYTREVALLLPAEQYDFQPTPDQMSFGAQLGHLASNILWLSSAYLGGQQSAPMADELPSDKEGLLQLLETALQQGATVLAQVQAEALEEKVDFFAGNFSRRQIIHLMHDHLTHHRAQMIVYLRLQGITPPKYRGW